MTDAFEKLKTTRTDPAQLKRASAALEASRLAPPLDAARGQSFVVEDRRWDFVMSREAAQGWGRLGKEPVVLGVLAHQFGALDQPEARRVLVALPARGGVRLEMRSTDGLLLWEGKGTLSGETLEFSMPISRPSARAKGMVSGRMGRDGRITLTEGRLPTPRGQAPKLESRE
jgi:hypothetical protein